MRPPPLPALVLLALLPLAGCNRPSYETPVKAYNTFLRAVQRGDEKTAYASLSQATQEALKSRAQAVAQASGDVVKAEPAAFFFANVPPPTDVKEVTLTREQGEVASVSVVSTQGSSEVRMTREASGWKLDLTPSLPQP